MVRFVEIHRGDLRDIIDLEKVEWVRVVEQTPEVRQVQVFFAGREAPAVELAGRLADEFLQLVREYTGPRLRVLTSPPE